MPLIVATNYMNDGYGDLLFGLRMVSGLKKELATLGYTDECYLVTSAEGKALIEKLKGDEEFGVKVFTNEQFEKMSADKNFKIDYFVSGPVKANEKKLDAIPKSIPLLFVPEYDFTNGNWHIDLATKYKNPLRKCHAVSSGLDEQEDKGIFICPELVNISDNIKTTDKTVYWNKLKEVKELDKRLFKDQSIEEYTKRTSLCLQYASKNAGIEVYEQYLKCNQTYMSGTDKDIDLFCLGGDPKDGDNDKKQALLNTISAIKKDGFTKIIFVNQAGKEEELYQDKSAAKEKVFRFVSYGGVSHPQIIALLAVSEDVVGVTGDQSLSEALSARKIPIYEARGHKENFCNKMSKFVQFANGINPRCDLIVTQEPPALNSISNLKIRSNAAYIRCEKKLFYVNKDKNICEEIALTDKQRVKFDTILNPTKNLRTLSEKQLQTVESLTDHFHHTNYIASLFEPQKFNKAKTKEKMLNFAEKVIQEYNLTHNIINIIKPEITNTLKVKEFQKQISSSVTQTIPAEETNKILLVKLTESIKNQDLLLFRYLMTELPEKLKQMTFNLILDNAEILGKIDPHIAVKFLYCLADLTKENPDIKNLFIELIRHQPTIFQNNEVQQAIRPLVPAEIQNLLDATQKELSKQTPSSLTTGNMFAEQQHSKALSQPKNHKKTPAKNDSVLISLTSKSQNNH